MTKKQYEAMYAYMASKCTDAGHGENHVRRVTATALRIADEVPGPVDRELLTAACLLHDVAKTAEIEGTAADHAATGAVYARQFLLDSGWAPEAADAVAEMIRTHRYTSGGEPRTVEAKILSDADKLDCIGAIGIARELLYTGRENQPLYTFLDDHKVDPGDAGGPASFLQEYARKCRNVANRLYTAPARRMASGLMGDMYRFRAALLEQAAPQDALEDRVGRILRDGPAAPAG